MPFALTRGIRKIVTAGLTLKFRFIRPGQSLRIHISYKLPATLRLWDWGPHFENHCIREIVIYRV